MATTTFNDLITFSRGTNATLTGPNGLIQWAPHNLLTNSQDFENANWVKSGLGVGTAPVVTANAAVAPDGSTTADQVALVNSGTTTGDWSWLYQNFIPAANTTYVFSVWLKAATPGDVGKTVIISGLSTTTTTLTADWQRVSVSGTTASTATISLGIRIRGNEVPTTSATFFIWGAQLELGSTATAYNNTSVRNLLGFSEAFDNAAWVKDRASIVTGAQANPVNGLFNAQKLMEDTTASNSHRVRQTVNLGSVPITFSAYLKAAERTWAYLRIDDASSTKFAYFNLATGAVGFATSGLTSSITSVGNGWYRCSTTFAAPAASASGSFVIGLATGDTINSYTGDGNSGVYIYGAQLSNSASLDPYVPTPGAAPSSTAYYGPRLDYDPVTLQPKGLLIEEQRTNLLLRSQEFNTSWGVSSVTVSADTTVAPDGTTTGDTITASTATAYISQSATFTADADKSFSVFLKAGTSTATRLVLRDTTAATNRATIDITWTAGVPSGVASAGTLQGVDNFGNGWYRVRGLATGVIAANTNQFRFSPDTADGTKSVIIWGAQAENAAFATSYIPTVASTVTRSADVATMTGTNFSSWFNATDGSFVFSGDSAYGSGGFIGSTPTTGAVLYANSNASRTFNGTNFIGTSNTYANNAAFSAVPRVSEESRVTASTTLVPSE